MIEYIPMMVGSGIFAVLAITFGSFFMTRYKIKHGYPLEGMWGQALKPELTTEAMERVSLLSQENAQLRAEVGSIKDRLANVERIATEANSLEHRHTKAIAAEIDALRQKDPVQ